MILDDIVENKQKEVHEAKKKVPLSLLESTLSKLRPAKGFLSLSRSREGVKIIAEVKKASPSKGVFVSDFDPIRVAKSYEENGAFAISVLTDSCFFQGSLEYLKSIRNEVELPLLRKDFTIDSYQIYEARCYGADMVLLIVSILEKEQIKEFCLIAEELGMDAIVEVHDEKELEIALSAGSKIIGINNRDLRTFKVDINTSIRLANLIPEDVLVISESGIKEANDIASLYREGISTFLVGEALMKGKDPGEKLRSIQEDLGKMGIV